MDIYSVRYEHLNDLRNARRFESIYDCSGCRCCCGCADCYETRLRENELERIWEDYR